MIEKETEKGTIRYSENALAQIIGTKACRVPGVKALATKNAVNGLWKRLQKEQYANGIEIEHEGDNVKITVAIVVSTEIKFSEVAKNVIEAVKHDIEGLTDLKVVNVTVLIQDVIVEDE